MEVASQYPRSRGISLIELLTVLVVSSILVSVAIPAWQGVTARNRIGAARMEMISLIQFARSSAIHRGKAVTLCPSTDGVRCSGDWRNWQAGTLLFEDRDRDRQHDPDEAMIRIGQGHSEIIIQSSHGRRSIRFGPDGSAWGSNLTLRFCSTDPQLNRALILYGSGRTRTSDTSSSGAPIRCL
ncbi:MAG: prepilin-type N-terminal cleavage/methylation domain-containing protein [Gammaproteobacteria bacterium]|nr:MAG: prepilin-type N-terminal cleavage/methylation domain-containing protein [Gammaproteobacteria bacterium]